MGGSLKNIKSPFFSAEEMLQIQLEIYTKILNQGGISTLYKHNRSLKIMEGTFFFSKILPPEIILNTVCIVR